MNQILSDGKKQLLPESCSPEYTKYKSDFSLIPNIQTPKTYFNNMLYMKTWWARIDIKGSRHLGKNWFVKELWWNEAFGTERAASQGNCRISAILKLSIQQILLILSASDIEQMQQTSLQSEAL